MSVFIKVHRTARSYFPYTLEQLLQRKKKWEGGGGTSSGLRLVGVDDDATQLLVRGVCVSSH